MSDEPWKFFRYTDYKGPLIFLPLANGLPVAPGTQKLGWTS